MGKLKANTAFINARQGFINDPHETRTFPLGDIDLKISLRFVDDEDPIIDIVLEGGSKDGHDIKDRLNDKTMQLINESL